MYESKQDLPSKKIKKSQCRKEQKWTEYALMHIMQPKPAFETRKGKKATERIALNGIGDDFRLPLLLLILKLIMLGNRLKQNKNMDRQESKNRQDTR